MSESRVTNFVGGMIFCKIGLRFEKKYYRIVLRFMQKCHRMSLLRGKPKTQKKKDFRKGE